MKKSLGLWQFAGFTAVVALGTLLHFLYSWVKTPSIAILSAINESTWEHMKILFFPMFIFAIVQSFFFKAEYPDFWTVKLLGTLLGTLLIPVLFYTISGAFGKTPDWLNIAFFFLSAGSGYALEARLFRNEQQGKEGRFALWIFIFIAVLFAAFTFFPPKLPLFQDPITGKYGI